jgi:hypothetical protein
MVIGVVSLEVGKGATQHNVTERVEARRSSSYEVLRSAEALEIIRYILDTKRCVKSFQFTVALAIIGELWSLGLRS